MKEEIYVALCGIQKIVFKNKVISFPYKKSKGLFCYLCVEKRASREELMNLFWGECSEKTARKNLRDALYRVKKAFGEQILISNNKNFIELNNKYHFKTDVEDILKNENINSYQGEFLQGFYIKSCENFNDWKEFFANELQSSYIQKISEKIEKTKNTYDIKKLEQYVSIIIRFEPYDEEIYRNIMKAYAHFGKYNKSIEIYYNLVNLLRKDLGIDPESITKEVYGNILKLRNKNNESIQKGSCFYGRHDELFTVSNILNRFITSKGKSIMIYGETGIGKTSFLNKIQDMINYKKIIVFRSTCYSAEKSFYLKSWSQVFENIDDVMKNEGIEISNDYNTIINKIFPNFKQNNIKYSQNFFNNFSLQQFNDAIIYLFKKLSKKKKLIFIFDDMQYMDTAGKNLLSNLLNHIGNNKIILIGSYREDFKKHMSSFVYPMIRDEKILELELSRFNKHEVRVLSQKIAPEVNWTETLIDKVYKDTEGNLLFLTEIIKLIKIRGYTKDLSLKFTHIIENRLKDLSEKELKFLQILSVFYDNVNMEKLLFLLDFDAGEIFDIIESLQEKYLIEEVIGPLDINYKFKHRKVRDYIYSIQSVGKLKYLHQKIGKFLEGKLQNNHKDILLYVNLIYHFEKSKNIEKLVIYRIKNLLQYTNFSIDLFPMLSFKDNSMITCIFNIDNELKQIKNEFNILKTNKKTNEILNMKYNYLSGRYHIYMGEYNSGLNEIKIALQIALKHCNKDYMKKCYTQMIYYGIQVTNTEILKIYIDESMKIISNNKKSEEMATLYRFKGIYYIKNFEYSQAEEVLRQAIKMFESLEDNSDKYILSIAGCYNYLGQIKKYQKDYKKAFEFYKKSIDLCEDNNIIKCLDLFYTNIAQVMFEMSYYDECKKFLNTAFSYYDKFHTIWGREIAEGYASLLAIKMKDFKTAYKHLRKSEELAKKIDNPFSINLVKRIKNEINI